jgi:hypothetical protein
MIVIIGGPVLAARPPGDEFDLNHTSVSADSGCWKEATDNSVG